jgi:hypothetical protein
VAGPLQQVAAWQEGRAEPVELDGQLQVDQAQVVPCITVVEIGGIDAKGPTVMAASDFGWSMADVGDDGVDQVPGEQAAFDDILPEPGQDDAEAVRAENEKLLEDKIKKALINGLPPTLQTALRAAIDLDNCRERLGADGGMRVEPAEVFPDEWLQLNRKSGSRTAARRS